MATIRKRGKTYQIDYFDPNGKRVRKSFKKRKDAERHTLDYLCIQPEEIKDVYENEL